MYSDMYAQEAVNPHSLSNYIHVSAEDPAVCAEVPTDVPTSAGGGYVGYDALPPAAGTTSTTSARTTPTPTTPSTQTHLVHAWLQRQVTGSQIERELRSFSEGYFCVRKSASTVDCVVLSLMGPASTVYHYQFKATRGVVQIHPARKSKRDPTFASHSECLDFYLAGSVSTTGLAARPTVCIPLPHTPSHHGTRQTTSSAQNGGAQRRSIKLIDSAHREAGAPIDC